jgi:hypothetical protein
MPPNEFAGQDYHNLTKHTYLSVQVDPNGSISVFKKKLNSEQTIEISTTVG